jgi:hypothetical protein
MTARILGSRSLAARASVVVALSLFALAACTSEIGLGSSPRANAGAAGREDDATGARDRGVETTATGLPCDVDRVLKTRCQTCHAKEPRYGASLPLVTFDDLSRDAPSGGKKVYELVRARVHDDARPMPPSPNARLSPADAATLDGWIAGGAKPSSDVCTSEKADDGVKPLSCTPDTTLKATSPFTMQQGGPVDQYVCFGVDVNVTSKRHVIGLAPKVDNKKILHHILLFQSTESYGGAPRPCEAFGSASWKLVAGWAPGGNNLELPQEAGFPEEKGTTHWIVQLHYNNAQNLAGQVDQSGYELCTTDKLRPYDAGVVAFGSTKFEIPPRSTTTIRCDYRLPSSFDGVKMFNASPHMHTRGTAMSTERLPGGTGAPETVFAQPAFSFENQANYPIKAQVAAGDVMRTRCTWKNPGDTTISFGEGTGDEMCFDFIGYYPNIPDRIVFGLPVFSWVTPSAFAKCTTE